MRALDLSKLHLPMKKILLLALSAACLAVAGCESMTSISDRMGERLSPSTAGVTKVFAGQQREVHAHAKQVVQDLGFRITRAGAAQGIIEAVNGVQADHGMRGSRQLSLKVNMTQYGEGVQVRIAISEIQESDSERHPGMGTETPMLDTPLYAAFFRALEKRLPKVDAAAGTPSVPANQPASGN